MAVTLAIADDLWRGLRDHLLAARHERIAFVLARDAGERLLARETLAIPDAALEVRAADRVSLQLDALIDAMNAAADSGLVLVETHSHPRSRGRVEFSPVDLRGQAEMASYLSGIMPGRPYAALVIGRNAVRGRIWRDGRADDLGSISVLGSCLERWPADGLRYRMAASPPPARERHSRQALAFGREGQTRIARTRVAIVGLGGIGSLVAMQLAHLGVRDLVLIDDDLVEASNLNASRARAPPTPAARRSRSRRTTRDVSTPGRTSRRCGRTSATRKRSAPSREPTCCSGASTAKRAGSS